MGKIQETFRNIFKIHELRDRILYTLGLLVIVRIGAHITLPGIDSYLLAEAMANKTTDNLLGLYDMFAGGAFSNAAIFALGIMPYISASIIIQLGGAVIPYFQKLQKDGENGQRKQNQITRIITIGITIVQGSAYLTFLNSQQGVIMPEIPPTVFWLANIIILTAGTVFCMWLGERITDKGIGNGISLLITAGIIAALPGAFVSEFQIKLGSGQLIIFIVEMALFVAVVMASVALVQAVRKIKIQFAKHMIGKSNLTGLGTERDYLPIKLNAAGVMPIIFAQALMFVPGAIASSMGATGGFWAQMADFTSLPYNIVFFLLVVIFTYVYTALIVNPQQYADHLKRQNAFIPGVKQGNDTAEYIDDVTTLVTLPGSIALGFISIIPGIAAATITTNIGFAIFYGGTSLLILVAVVLDTLQQIDGHMSMHGYDVRKIKGRTRTKEAETDSVL